MYSYSQLVIILYIYVYRVIIYIYIYNYIFVHKCGFGAWAASLRPLASWHSCFFLETFLFRCATLLAAIESNGVVDTKQKTARQSCGRKAWY